VPAGDRAREDREAAVFGTEAWRVPGSVDFIGFDGNDFIVASQSGAVVRYGRDGARRIIAERALPDVADVAMHDGALYLANESIVRVDLAGGAVKPVDLGQTAYALAIAGNRAIVGDSGEGPLRIVDVAKRTVLAELEHSRGYNSPSIVGDRVIAGRSQRAAGIWNLQSGKRERAFAVGNATLFAMSPDGRLIATGAFYAGSLQAIDINEVATGERTATINLSCSPGALAFSPASDRLAIACQEEVRVVKAPSGEEIAKLAGPRSYVRTIAWSPAGDLLALGGNDNVLHAWRTDTWQPLSRVTGSRGEIRELAVAGRFLVSHSWGDSSAWLWVTDLVKPAIELGGKDREILSVAGDGDGILVALTRTPGTERRASIERWRGVSRIAQATLPSGRFGMAPLVRALGPVRGGGVWFTAEGRVTVLDPELRPRWTSPSTADDPEDIADGDADATADGATIVLRAGKTLSVISGVERRTLATQPYSGCGSSGPTVSPDGKRFALIDPKGVFVFSTQDAKLIASLGLPTDDDAERAIEWSRRGEVLALAGSSLVAWDVDGKSAVAMPAANVLSLAVDGDRVYFGRNDGTIARRSLTSMRSAATVLPITRPAACEEQGGSAFGTLGGFGGDDEPRGRLPDDGAYDEPDPTPGSD
jgi:WD40 repeat protein